MTRTFTLIITLLVSIHIFGQPVTVVDASAFGQRVAAMSADAENALSNLEQLLEQADRMQSQVARMDSIKNKVTKVSDRIKMSARFLELLQESKNAMILLRYGAEVITKSRYLTASQKTSLALSATKKVNNLIDDVKQIKELIEHPEKSEMSEHERYNEITRYEYQITSTIASLNMMVLRVKQIDIDRETRNLQRNAFSIYGVYHNNKKETKKSTKKINW